MGAFPIPGFPQATNWLTLVLPLGSASSLRSLIGPWRPPQWNHPQVYSLTVPVQQTGASAVALDTNGQPLPGSNSPTNPRISGGTSETTYFFDAVLRAEHNQELRHTEHPIQSGSSITDHAYLVPARVVLEIGVSDCMASFVSGQFTSSGSKSISAFKTLTALQASAVPLTLSTRLAVYENMLIESIRAVENNATKFSLRVAVTFIQIIVADLATQTVSARPDATDTTNEGQKQPLPFNPAGSQQFLQQFAPLP